MRIITLGSYKIHFTDDVLLLMAQFKQINSKQHEAGGILLGQVKENNIYITRISFPSESDKSSRYSFYRNKKNAQAIIDYEFHNSNKRTIYLGEWHTHPEDLPNPSDTDRKMINDQFSKNKLNEPFLLQYIQGLKGFYLALIEKDSNKEVRICDN
ncbi:Mov34/MPN/PAD-1 family protein [Tenacibaculum holothuriorum]|uniref:Mov34/MPN/PAD-1 family protein n=1 Tax=Tenacibaculum holothuriorum TaxID=1635173 RepID=UPI000A3200A0|nr:Mov34/MPN/PAD-1 family protein [Tenacibaculum holothuriorum]